MLHITFKPSSDLIRAVDAYFDNWHDPEWFNDPLVRQIVKDVDLTEVQGPHLAISPVLGAIPPTRISGGSKSLIMALKTDKLVYGSAMGDNCAEWLLRIGELKDIRVYMGHLMNFPRDFRAFNVDEGKYMNSIHDFECAYLRARGYDA